MRACCRVGVQTQGSAIRDVRGLKIQLWQDTHRSVAVTIKE